MISDNHIQVFVGSLQKIKIDTEFNYDGWDFDGYEKLNKELKTKIFNQTYAIAKKLQQMGYRGIGGIDYIEKDGEVYFMEINPRFQTSSQELDNILIKNKFPSIFELNYLCFKNEKKFIEICAKISKKFK